MPSVGCADQLTAELAFKPTSGAPPDICSAFIHVTAFTIDRFFGGINCLSNPCNRLFKEMVSRRLLCGRPLTLTAGQRCDALLDEHVHRRMRDFRAAAAHLKRSLMITRRRALLNAHRYGNGTQRTGRQCH